MENLERKPEPTEIPEEYLKEYIAGNARFPTFAFTFVILIANAAIFDEKFDPVSFARSRLSENQLERLKHKIATQHAHNNVPLAPAGHEDFVRETIARLKGCTPEEVHVQTVKDDNFQRMWHSHVNHALGIIGALAGVRRSPEEDIIYRPFIYTPSDMQKIVDDKKLMALAQEVARRLQDENVRMEVQNVLRSFAKVLNSQYGEKRSKGIRAAKDTHISRPLHEELFNAMIKQYRRDVMDLGYRRVLSDREIKAFQSRFFHV